MAQPPHRSRTAASLRQQHGQPPPPGTGTGPSASAQLSTAPAAARHRHSSDQQPDQGPNPGEGVSGSEPGGPNRARDSAALRTVAENNLTMGIPLTHP